MHDIRCTNIADMFYQELLNSVSHFKETERGRNQVVKQWKNIEEIIKER
jgi:hypothetical protein